MVIREQIGNAIRDARVAAGKSQEALAEHLGVSFSTVSRFEAGRIPIPSERLVKIARWLRIDPADLLPKRLPRGRKAAG